jgi:prefoldin alpha subunit
MEKNQQELMMKLSMFEQQIQSINQQIQSVEKALVDLNDLNLGLDEIKKDNEIFALIGKGIYTKAKITSKDLVVNIGGNNLVNKSIPETKEIIKQQMQKLTEMKQELEKALEEINTQLTNTMMEHQKEKK